MAIDKIIVRTMAVDFLRLVNKIGKLDKQSFDFGTGDVLFPTEIHVIEEIGKGNARTGTELCRLFGVTKGAVSQIVGKLSAKGYVAKARNESFGKEVLLSLTPKGNKAFEAHRQLHDAMDDDFVTALEGVSPEQVELFSDVLKKIEKHVDRYIDLKR